MIDLLLALSIIALLVLVMIEYATINELRKVIHNIDYRVNVCEHHIDDLAERVFFSKDK